MRPSRLARSHQRRFAGLEPRVSRSGGVCTAKGNSGRSCDHRGGDLKAELETVYSREQLAKCVRSMGRAISRDYEGRTVDVVIMLENACVFAADLLRSISGRVVCHFVRAEVRDVQFDGHSRREIYFGRPPRLENRDVLVVDAVVQSGVTQEFLLRRLQESKPRSLRLAALFNKP